MDKTSGLHRSFKMDNTSGLRQFLILLYKGLLLRKRHYIVTIFEIVIPVLIVSILTIIMSESSAPQDYNKHDTKDKSVWINFTTYEPFDPYISQGYSSSDVQFVYAPSNDITDKFMADAVQRYQLNSQSRGEISNKSTNSERELEIYCLDKQRADPYTVVVGTVFNNFFGNSLPESLDYKIRYGRGASFSTQWKYRVNGPQYGNEYVRSYFLGWQTAVEETFIESKMDEKRNISYKVMMQRFPYPEHRDARSFFSVISIVPWLICFGFLIFIINIVRRIIEEKANGSKELLKMMGMTDFVYWSSTFMNYFIVALITMLIITIVYKAPLKNSYMFLKHMDFMLLYLFLLLFMASLILFCMAFSIFFPRAIFAIIALIIVHIVSFVLLYVNFFLMDIELNYMSLPLMQKLGICLLPSGSLLSMFTMISFYEYSGVGVRWSNITEFSVIPDLNALMVILSMLVSCGLYVIIIWYFDKVWPWQPGVPKPFYFLFTRSYWCGPKSCESDGIELITHTENSTDFFEEEPSSSLPGVIIKNLSKEFRSGLQTKLAVNDVSLNIYTGQITALLGHNGAGKTTMINILTGLFSPSKGSASINGMDILTETTRARRGLGVCPQHNVLYDTLTVEEHLRIYAALKGVSWRRLTDEATSVLKILKLIVKRNELVKNLSGGMKRKLSLAIAIVGGSEVLFLDEPTSGMDVEARRSVWDALLDIRRNRTIILTTHYMEEADILGDRIAIMAEGEVQCCGSPMFLKQKFGTGYHLHVVKDTHFELNGLKTVLENFIPGVTVGNELEKEITFNLSSNTGANFGEMFEEVENAKQKLGVVSFGITITTMEDVFLKIANISDVKYKTQTESEQINGVNSEFEDVYGESNYLTLRRDPGNQLLGLLLKRFHYAKRHWSILVAQLVIPFILLCVCLYAIRASSNQYRNIYNPLEMDINFVYGKTEGFYFSNGSNPKLVENLKNVLESNNVHVEAVSNPTQYILQYGKKDISKYFKTLLVGGAIDSFSNGTLNLTAWYNGEPFHTAPMSLLLMHTAILRHVTNTGTITLTNAPLREATPSFTNINGGFIERILSAVFIPLLLAFISASFTLIPIHERASKAKLLQLMSGVPAVLYWISMFIWDFLVYSVICIILLIPFAFFSHYVFFAPHSAAIGTALLLFLLYGWASVPFSYLVSFIVKKGNTGFAIIVGICAIFGVGLGTSLRYVQIVVGEPPAKQLDALIWFFRLLPTFSASVGFSNLFAISYSNAVCESVSPEDLQLNCESPSMGPRNDFFKCCIGLCGNQCLTEIHPIKWDKDGCGPDIFFLIFDGALYFLLLLLLETSTIAAVGRSIKIELQRLKKSIVPHIMQESIPVDPDVLAEEERVRNLRAARPNAGDEALMVLDLTKVYRNFYAVDHLTFAIHQKECFGLLGVNGAGKTTTFQMLTGDCYPTDGNALIQDCSVRTSLKKFQSYLGYCPQFDALIDRLTGREMLQLFARLRGLSGSELEERVNKMIKMTDLAAHADKQSQFYSGGNKRKLSVGIALIGSPPLLLLDEPTAGVDPVSRRKIWNILSQARNKTGAAVILTTHSMEESEALCSRLAIMVNGRFRCLGSIQQLKSKYGQGYTLIIKMKSEDQNNPDAVYAIKAHVESSMNGAQLKDDHQGMLQYHIIDPSVTLSRLFKLMSNMKSQFNLEDYLISDTSLEQIFLTFARAQRLIA